MEMLTGHGQNLPLLWSGKHFIGFSMLKDAIPSSVLLHSASEVLPLMLVGAALRALWLTSVGSGVK